MLVNFFPLLLGVYFVNAENKGFVLIAPSRFGSEEKICISFRNAVAEKLAVTLWEHKSDVEIVSAVSSISGFYGCLTIRIPIRPPQSTLARLEVKISNNDDSSVTRASRTVHLLPDPWLTFITTDKPIYGAHDTVNVRAFIVDRNLQPLVDEVDKLWIENPQGVHIKQENNLLPVLGVIDSHFKLVSDPLPGTWKIKIQNHGHITAKSFLVEKHIMPSLNISIIAPRSMEVNTHTSITICAKYIFGKPVKGSVRIKMSVDCAFEYYCKKDLEPVLLNMTLDSEGCARENLMADRIDGPYLQHVVLNATVEEFGTGVVGQKSEKIVLLPSGARSLIKGVFRLTTKRIKPGLPFLGNLILTSELGKWGSILVTLCRSFDTEKVCTAIETTDGVIPFTIPPGKSAEKVQIEASWTNTDNKNSSSIVYLRPWISPSSSYVQIFHSGMTLSCDKALKIVVLHTLDEEQDFLVMVKSRGTIILFQNASTLAGFEQGEYEWNSLDRLSLGTATEKKPINYVTFILEPTPSFSPEAALVVFTRNNDEVVADSTLLRFQNCFPFEVHTTWNTNEAEPGETVALTITSEPNSSCAVTAVDSKVFLLQEESFSITSQIFREISQKFKTVYPGDNAYDLNRCVKNQTTERFSMEENFLTRDMSIFSDSLEAFESSGVIVMSDLNLVSRPCSHSDEIEPRKSDSANISFLDNQIVNWDEETNEILSEEPIITVRSDFPDVFYWFDFLTRSKNTTYEGKLPGTITEWTAQAVCLSATLGLSVSNPATIRSFRPFFIDFSLPMSIRRHERLHLAVSVFNNMNTSAPIMLSMKPLKSFHIRGNLKTAMCVPANDKLVHVFQLVAVKLGPSKVVFKAEIDPHVADDCGPVLHRPQIDIVEKATQIRAEGDVIEEIQSGLICSNDFISGQQPNKTDWNIKMSSPEYVPDSISCQVRISGNIFGPAILGIDDIIQKPTGCGEQTATIFVINHLIIKYIHSHFPSDNLKRDRLDKAMSAIFHGYQQLLNFRHSDGSFSAFGPEAGSKSSMWLTAFILPYLNHTLIRNEDVFSGSLQWVLHQQLENGCFPKIGDIYHWDTQTGDSPVALTAFILISLLKSGLRPSDPAVKNALICIQTPYYETDRYTELLTVYALALANERREASARMRKILKEAERSYDTLWWENVDSRSVESSIEMTSYGILTLLELNGAEFLSSAAYALRWIMQFQNNNGGFISTQDTLLGLEAVTKFSMTLPKSTKGLNIVTKYGNDVRSIAIDEKNQELLQSFEIPPFTTRIQFKAVGSGCALVQTAIKYNVRKMKPGKTLKIHLRVDREKGSDDFPVHRVEACIRTAPGIGSTNMAILEINLPTGYYPERSSLYRVTETENEVFKFEEFEDHVNFYMNKLNNHKVCVTFLIQRENCIENPAPIFAKIYDYYNSNYSSSVRYKMQETCDISNLINASPDIVHLRKRRESTGLFSNFKDVSHDLDAPNEIGNGFKLYAMPPATGKDFEKCPKCLKEAPAIFPKLYCSSQVAAQIRFRGKHLLDVMKNVSPQTNFTKIQRNVAFSIKNNCLCDLLSSGSKALMLVTPPRTFNLQSIQIFHIDDNITLIAWKNVARFIEFISNSQNSCKDILTSE